MLGGLSLVVYYVLIENLGHRPVGSLLFSTDGLVLEYRMTNTKVQLCCQPTE